jgi:adenylate kinase
MFRDHKSRGTEMGKRIQAIMDAGGLVTDDITNSMVKERLSRPDVAKGLILDGYPRTTAQAEYLESLLGALGRRIDRVVSYEVAEELVIERISGRRSCPRCGAVYHIVANPPRRSGLCDRDEATLVQRDDDKPENVKKRMKEYVAKTLPLKRFYEHRQLLVPIEGVGAPGGAHKYVPCASASNSRARTRLRASATRVSSSTTSCGRWSRRSRLA